MKRDIDIVGILNWAKEQSERDKPRTRGYRQYRRDVSPLDKLFADFLEDQLRTKFKEMDDKLNKKEEKKKEESWWDKQSFIQKLTVLTVTVPFGMMTLIIACLAFAKTIKLFF